jgi:hypothetical protein
MKRVRLVRGVRVFSLGLAVVLWAGQLGVSHGEGPGTAGRSGTGSITSDFNGDGFGDLAVGSYLEDVGLVADAGAVNVLYGSGGGLQATLPDDQLWTQDSLDVEDEAEPGDGFGWSLAPGDFNGDGYGDLAVGSLYEDVGSVTNAGAVHVLYGSILGLQATFPEDQLWTRDSVQGEGQAESADKFGRSLVAGDFDADGISDLAIGAPFQDLEAGKEAGAVYVLYGSTDGLLADEQLWTLDSADVEEEAGPWDLFAWALAAGDYDGDGFADLAIGIPLENIGDVLNAGGVHVLFGSAEGLQATSPDDQHWTQDSPDVEDQVEAADEYGAVLEAEDFNADGFEDLAIAVTSEDLGVLRSAAAVNVLYGSAGGLQATSPEDQFWTQDSPDIEDEAELQDRWGWSVATGDLNGDGFGDLAVGARLEDLATITLADAGAVNVIYGSAGGLQATSPEDQLWTQDSPEIDDDAELGDRFGRSLSTGDYNGDGYADLTVGVPAEDVGLILDAGAVNVLYGSSGSLQATAPEDQLWTQDNTDIGDDAESRNWFGYSLPTGG